MRVPGQREPMPGEVPLFEMNDPVLFPPVNPQDGPDSEASDYWRRVNRKVDTRGISEHEARREEGWPPDWPRRRRLVDAVLDGTFDPNLLT